MRAIRRSCWWSAVAILLAAATACGRAGGPGGRVGATPTAPASAIGGPGEGTDAGCLRGAAGDVDAMASAMSALAADPAIAVALGREGRAMVAERFARAPIESRLRALYDAAAGFVASGAAG